MTLEELERSIIHPAMWALLLAYVADQENLGADLPYAVEDEAD